MTVKAMAALYWTRRHCSNAAYFLKADDDAFVNEFAALKHLRDIQLVGYRRHLLMCLPWHRPPVSRVGKWAASEAEFARQQYPTYCCGLGYVVSGDVIAQLLAADACQQIRHPNVTDHLDGTHLSDNSDVRNLPLHNDVTNGNDVTDAANGDHVVSDIGTSWTYDITFRRRFWIDDVYVTGLLVEALGGRIQHTNMSAVYCKSDKMAAVYRHVTEWYKYLFTEVGDNEAELYWDTWDALRRRAAETTIPSPSVIRPGRLANTYIPLSTMLQLANNQSLNQSINQI